ncbi:CHAT domain-containing protein [Acanthopleuribacter pedis]|uniref:CHAT domain-containing protein n=1 Tax=Acanthopleuribacter pedis TaxID=442870 RepID=A0A8J7QNT2_9BACT|nr:CHAT domain-containing protein [Acanthopleuribacter pedis]MBO1322520.1 CHAT domain-containing protein [Acanthopleuribacter pedis]
METRVIRDFSPRIWGDVTRFTLLAVLLLLLGCTWSDPAATEQQRFQQRLNELAAGNWPVAGRLAGVRQNGLRRTATADPVQLAALRLKWAESANESQRGCAALFDLLAGKPEAVLGESSLGAQQQQARDADDLNHRVVALMTRGAEQESWLSWHKALEALEIGFARGFDSPALQTNYALVLQQLWLNQDAETQWRKVLADERDPIWRDAAATALADLEERKRLGSPAEHRARLARALAENDSAAVAAWTRQFPGLAWQWLEQSLLLPDPNHGESAARARAAAVIVHDPARFRVWGDLLAELADSGTVAEQALRDLRALKAVEDGDDEQYMCGVLAAEAVTARFPEGSVFSVLARFYLARCFYYLNQKADAAQQAEWVDGPTRVLGYPTLTGKNLGLRAMLAGQRGDWARFYSLHREGLRLFKHLGDRRNISHFRDSVADSLHFFGQERRALEQHTAILSQSVFYARPKRRALLYSAVAQGLLAEGLPHAAERFAQTAAVYLDQQHDWFEWYRARRELARCRRQKGDLDAALALLDDTLGVLARHGGDHWAVQNEAELLAQRGHYRLAANRLEGARADLTRARGLYEADQQQGPKMFRIGAALARCARGLGDDAAALRYLREEVDLIEARRPRAVDEVKVGFFDAVRAVYDDLIQLHLDRGESEAALQAAERARARFLGDRVDNPTGTLDPARVQSALKPGEALLFYHVLADRLAVWVFTPQTLEHRVVPLSETDVAALVRLVAIARKPGQVPAVNRHNHRLYQWLLAPTREVWAEATTLLFALDGPLWHLAPAGLRLPDARGYLVNRVEVAVVPSLTMFQFLRKQTPRPSTNPACVVGNPRFDRQLWPLLPLPHAAQEARQVADRLNGTPLIGAAATAEAFLRGARDARLIHFAGHAVVQPADPLRSYLLLSPNPHTGSGGTLSAADLFALNLPQTQLVVLSGCDTGGPHQSRSEGGGNLARPFLTAGVPSVLATLAPLPDDEATVAFMNRFYDGWLAQGDPGRALRAAQIAAIENGVPEEIWASWQLFGMP